MRTFGYLKIPDIILSLVSLQKLDWTQTFGTYCTVAEKALIQFLYFHYMQQNIV